MRSRGRLHQAEDAGRTRRRPPAESQRQEDGAEADELGCGHEHAGAEDERGQEAQVLAPELVDAAQQGGLLDQAARLHGQEGKGVGQGEEQQRRDHQGQRPVDGIGPVAAEYRAAAGAEQGGRGRAVQPVEQVAVRAGHQGRICRQHRHDRVASRFSGR